MQTKKKNSRNWTRDENKGNALVKLWCKFRHECIQGNPKFTGQTKNYFINDSSSLHAARKGAMKIIRKNKDIILEAHIYDNQNREAQPLEIWKYDFKQNCLVNTDTGQMLNA
jgi:hypothetical protein